MLRLRALRLVALAVAVASAAWLGGINGHTWP
jgi:hypothetical protein